MYKFLMVLIRPIAKLLFRLKRENPIPLPEGPLVIIANHKSNFDPVMVSLCLDRQVHWMAKKELFENKLMAKFFESLGAFPVDRNNNDIRSMRKAMSILKEGQVLGIFPEGTRVKEVDYNLAKPGAALIASRMKAKILPIYIEGDYKLFRPVRIHFRNIIELDSSKRSEEDYREDIKNIMEIVYKGDLSIGDHSK